MKNASVLYHCKDYKRSAVSPRLRNIMESSASAFIGRKAAEGYASVIISFSTPVAMRSVWFS